MNGRIALAVYVLLAVGARSTSAEDVPKRVTPRGAVVGVDGKPISGARVLLRRWTGVMSEPLDRTTTDASGQFSLSERPDDVFYVTVLSADLSAVNLHVPDELPMTITLRPTVRSFLRIIDADSRPVSGASISTLSIRTPENPLVYVGRGQEALMEWEFPPSDSNGRLELPPLPKDALVDIRVLHPEWAQGKLENIEVAGGELGAMTLARGVRTTFDFGAETGEKPIPESFEFTMSLVGDTSKAAGSIVRLPFAAEHGQFQFTSHPGDYDLRFQSEGYVITPRFGEGGKDSINLKIKDEQPITRRFLVRRTVPCTGRVLGPNGSPLAGVGLSARIDNRAPEGVESGAGQYTYSEWRETDAKGAFTLPLPRGQSRLFVSKDGYEADQPFLDFTVSGDRHELGDIVIRPLPQLHGRVVDQAGQPVSQAIVRLRELSLSAAIQPAVTDSGGRFDIKLPFLPIDQETQDRLDTVILVAFTLDRPLSCVKSCRLSSLADGAELEVRLAPDMSDVSLLRLADNEAQAERRSKTSEEAKAEYPAGTPGSPTPELDSGEWFNSDRRRLADFRGKYVLLDFWFTGCGSCHTDFPSVKLIHQMLADKGVAVIGVHDNSSTPDRVREHCMALDLTFPVVVDRPDGRILKEWGAQVGVRWFPTYVLLGPDGKIVANDAMSSAPSLRLYKLEMIRELVLRGQVASPAAPKP